MQEDAASKHFSTLASADSSLCAKYLAIFELKALSTEQSLNYLMQGLSVLPTSELLRHEVTYALGQVDIQF